MANYCRDQVHLALEHTLQVIQTDEAEVRMRNTQQMQWEEVFTSCFLDIDDKVGGRVSKGNPGEISDALDSILEPLAPETVGSTAVVALISSSHIIVANCGDSRAVLYRGKDALALSNDHKVSRVCKAYIFLFCYWPFASPPFCLMFFFLRIFSQTEKTNMQELKHLEGRSYSGMGTVFLVYLQCQGPLVGLLWQVSN